MKRSNKLVEEEDWENFMEKVPKLKVTSKSRKKWNEGELKKKKVKKIEGSEISPYWNRFNKK